MVALVLSGGGARASYQVGVLQAVSEIFNQPDKVPFDVICGTSAGAINASLIACESDHFKSGVTLLYDLWSGLESAHVHEVGAGAVLSSLFSLLRSFYHDGYAEGKPWSLLDNEPLRKLLSRVVRFPRLSERIAEGNVSALCITALGYTTGDSLSFFEGKPGLAGWRRHRRVGIPAALGLDHLMASAAIPGIYPSVRIHREYFGDGAVRQIAPLSPALHLGARKLFVVGVSHNPRENIDEREHTIHSPSLAQMGTHLLNGSFIDALEGDIESMVRLNSIISRLSPVDQQELNLNKIDVMTITPSKAFDEVASRHIGSLPGTMRFLFKRLGANNRGGGSSLASYLMFESGFIQELIACGYEDAMSLKSEIKAFLGPS